MKASSKAAILSIVVLFFLGSMPWFSNMTMVDFENVDETSLGDMLVSLTPSGPITITSDGDFVIQGWPGSGIQGDPYRIEDLEFSSSDTSISIRNTTVYFTITGCSFGGGSQTQGRAISLEYVQNGSVDSCTFNSVQFGVWVEYSDNLTIVNNDCDYVGYGAFCKYSNNLTISGNTVIDARDEGIGTYFCWDCTIHLNSVTNGGEYGLWIYETYDSFLTNNTITHSGYRAMIEEWYPNSYGIRLGNCGNNTLIGNVITDSRDCGMGVGGNNFTLIENQISGSGPWGDISYGGDYGTFVDNILDKGILMYSSKQNQMTGNTVAGKPLGYFYSLSSTSIDISSFGQVILDTCNNVEVHSGVFTDVVVGIHLQQSTDCLVNDVNITDAREGIRLRFSTDCVINGSSISDSIQHGLYNYQSDGTSLVYSNITRSGGSGARIEWSDNCNLTSNQFMDNVDGGAYIYDSLYTYIYNNSFYGDGLVVNSQDTSGYDQTVIDNLVNEKPLAYFFNEVGGSVSDAAFGQLYVAVCDSFVIDNCNISNASNGIIFGLSTDCTIQNSNLSYNTLRGVWDFFSSGSSIINCTISNNGDLGIEITETDYTSMEGNVITKNDGDGIGIWASNYLSLEGNEILDNQGYGLICDWPQTWTVYRNNFSYNANDGLLLWHGWNLDVRNNTITHNEGNGFYLDESEYCTFVGNWIMDNDGYGFYVNSQSNDNTFYDNTIGDLSRDDGANDAWDNGVDLGNAWEDYNGEGDYDVPGNGGGVDHYPSIADFDMPSVDSPSDVIIELGTEGQLFMWNPTDDHPGNYTVYKNGSVYDIGSWLVHGPIVDADGLEIGNYNFTAIFEDMVGKIAKDTVWVRVLDTTSPIVGDQADLIIVSGVEDVSIAWTAEELSPHDYEVYFNGIIIKSGPWNSSSETVTIMITEFELGDYNYTIVFRDISGNSASDTVWLSVIVGTTITTQTTASTSNGDGFAAGLIGNIIVIGSVATIVVVGAMICKARKVAKWESQM